MIPPISLPPRNRVRKFLKAIRLGNPGLGIVDVTNGRTYLAVASSVGYGDHASLVKEVFGIVDYEDATHLRGFVIGREKGIWLLATSS